MAIAGISVGCVFERDLLFGNPVPPPHHILGRAFPDRALERDRFRMNRHRALGYCLSMICSENRHPFFRIML
jgi:hypothetical protein